MPVAAVLMQLATMLSARGLWLRLNWTPREANTEADALTNEEFQGFEDSLRIPVNWSELPMNVLRDVLSEWEAFETEMEKRKVDKAILRKQTGNVRQRKRRKIKEPWEAAVVDT
jgi:hypothetical protein